ncbi:MAG TPA: N-acetyltransferase [Anaeromyxobacter sp.]|nr:N-acetyltransferase [Anaeromyxobacter sp.]
MPSDDPLERSARPQRAASFRILPLDPGDPDLRALLRRWDWIARSLLSRGVSPPTRARLLDWRRVGGELLAVLEGQEEGEGASTERLVRAAVHRGEVQAVATIFLCRRAAFVELLVSAPWNLLGPDDPPEARAVRGAARALVGAASALARAGGARGRVALQAENPRCQAFYERMGFSLMRPSDAPLALVPRGKKGWSAPVVRLARGEAGPEERRAPWMLLDPEPRQLRVAVASPPRLRPGAA